MSFFFTNNEYIYYNIMINILMPDNVVMQQSNDKTLNLIMIGILIISILVIIIGMGTDITGTGVVVGSYTLSVSMILMIIIILKKISSNIGNSSKHYTLLMLIVAVNIIILAIIGFYIYTISYNGSSSGGGPMSHIEVIRYLSVYIKMFIFTIIAISTLNVAIVNNINSTGNSAFSDVSTNIFFVITETIILFMYSFIIFTIVTKYATDG